MSAHNFINEAGKTYLTARNVRYGYYKHNVISSKYKAVTMRPYNDAEFDSEEEAQQWLLEQTRWIR